MIMVTVTRLTDESRKTYQKIFGTLEPFSHVVTGRWNARSEDNAEPDCGWDSDDNFKDFEQVCKGLNCPIQLVMSSTELNVVVSKEGPLAQKGPNLKRGHGFGFVKLE